MKTQHLTHPFPGALAPVPAPALHAPPARPRPRWFGIGAALGLLLAPGLAQADTYTVVNNADSGPGSLREAIDTANANPGADTIKFDMTQVVSPITLTSDTYVIADDLTIQGPGAALLTLSGDHTYRVIYNLYANLIIDGLTIADGYSETGGAIYNDGGTLTLSDSTLSGNTAFQGGAIYNYSRSTLSISNSTLTGNTASAGGAISSDGLTTISSSTLIGNTATDGGTINNSGTLSISNSTLSGNTARARGGAIYNFSYYIPSAVTVVQSTLSGNRADAGGAIYNTSTPSPVGSALVTLHQTTLSGNSANNGGAILNRTDAGSATVEISHSTFSDNSARFSGGGIYASSIGDGMGTVALSHSLWVRGVTGNNYEVSIGGHAAIPTLTSLGYNLADDASLALAGPGDQNNVATLSTTLGPLADNSGPTLTHALLPGSPAIDAGDPAFDGSSLPFDQRGTGFPRVANGRVDIGAFEFQPTCDTPVATITGPASGSVYAVGTPVTFTGTFTGESGPHTAVWTIGGDAVAGSVDEDAKTVSATVTFSDAGVYPVQLTVTNDCGHSGSADTVGDLAAMVVIYDPTAGFVTGGGWINSPAGAAAWDETLTGKASFGFVSRYQRGATVPTGNTEFQFKAGALNFKSTSYQWLVVSGARAQYKGEGTINGVAGYSFLLTAIDGQLTGGGGADKFRIKIQETATGTVVYDNQMDADDGADPTTVIGGGSIVIHK
jgi:predicted outer membrane repeat protein